MENLLLTHNLIIIVSLLIAIIGIGSWLFYRRYQRQTQSLLHHGAEHPQAEYDTHVLDDGDAVDPLFDDEEAHENKTATAAPSHATPAKQLIIALYVIAQDEQGFNGLDIFAVLEELGMRHGNMQIFHHYGLGDTHAKQAVFSVASMVEPGILKRDNVEQFYTPGLVFFTQLPGPVGGRVALELMLSQMHKIAEELNGQLVDERHEELNTDTAEQLRQRIAEFEQ